MYVLEKTVNYFDKIALKLFKVQWLFAYSKCIHNSQKKMRYLILSHWWNSSFQNNLLEIFRISFPNITYLQKTKYGKSFMIYNFFYFNDKCRIICRKTKMSNLNITFFHNFLYRIITNSPESLFLQKKSNKRKDQNIYFSSNSNQM